MQRDHYSTFKCYCWGLDCSEKNAATEQPLYMNFTPDEALYTRPFLLLCLSHALFAGSFNMMIPELPAYLTSLGGGEHKGLIIALFTLTAGFSRPFSGKLADTIGEYV